MIRTTARFAIALLLLATAVPGLQAQLPDCYHTLDEAYQFLFDLAADPDYSSRIKIDSVGHSQADHQPIYLVKVSDDAHTDYDRPATLVVGHIHAEEILGLEATLTAIDTLVRAERPAFRARRENLEMYFIPTMNPEGLTVVWGEGDLAHGADVTYRKNKRDNLEDGVFRYQVGWGNDTSGVDPNRNFDINWFHGNTLLYDVGTTERYDYYRGPAPFSESEASTVADIVRQIRPLYSITYHSSRSGNFSEKVMYPWDWGLDQQKMAPDQDVLDDIATNFASLLPRLDGGGTYEPGRSGGRNGKMHDWMYAEGGWVNMQTEIGNANIQPSCDLMQQVVQDVLPAMFYLLDRAYGSNQLESESSYLEVRVQDDQGSPLVAEVHFPERSSGYLKPRMTDPVHGVHRLPLLAGNYTVVTRAWGYEPDTSLVNVGTFGAVPHNVTLAAKPTSPITLAAMDHASQQDVPATFVVHRAWGVDTLEAPSGRLELEWPHGAYRVEAWADGYAPRRIQFTHSAQSGAWIYLAPESPVATEDFEGALPETWSSGGDFVWLPSTLDSHTGSKALKSDSARFIAENQEGWVTASFTVPAEAEGLVLEGWRAYELEPDYDFARIEYRVDGGAWQELETLNGFARWHRFFHDLAGALGGSGVEVRWTVATDENQVDRGLFLDDLVLHAPGDYNEAPDPAEVPVSWSLQPAWPNPFNPSTTLQFDVARQRTVTVAVHDLLGREVLRLVEGELAPGRHSVQLNLEGHASGVYIVRMQAGTYRAVRKVVLMK